MDSAMVTGRMSRAKKDAGGKVLEKLGTNASESINMLYDYVLEHGALPFASQQCEGVAPGKLQEAREYLESIPHLDPCEVDTLGPRELKRRRLVQRGVAQLEDFA